MVFRVQKTKNYTVMSNAHLKDRNLSLKAKGLLSVMLSLPDDWDYSIDGLVSISKENKTAIQAALKELEQQKYLVRTRIQDEHGRFDYIYDIYEQPQPENPSTVNPSTEEPQTENQPQLITKELNTKKLNTKESVPKHKHGEYNHVLLTDEQYEKLCNELDGKAEEYIRRLDEYIEMKGAKYKNHYLTIKNWYRKDTGNNYDDAKKRGIEIDEDFREGFHDIVFNQY